MDKIRILSIDDEDNYFQQSVRRVLSSRWNYETSLTFENGLEKLRSSHFDVLLLDKDLGKQSRNGIELLPQLKSEFPQLIIIMLTYSGDFNGIIQALQHGASDYITKSDSAISDLQIRIPECLNRLSKDQRLRVFQKQVPKVRELIGLSEFVRSTNNMIQKFAGTNLPVLISGENGSGKATVAQALWNTRDDPSRPFYRIRIFESEESELMNELFLPDGAFVLAKGGDLVLEGIEFLSIKLQKILTTLISSSTFKNPITESPFRFEGRLICTTEESSERFANSDRFCKSFLDAFVGRQIHIFPLRDRIDDIHSLSLNFLSHYKFKQLSLTDSAVEYLKAQKWPGNISQLQSLLKLCATDMRTKERTSIDTPDILRCQKSSQLINHNYNISLPLRATDLNSKKFMQFTETCEKAYLQKALDLCNYDPHICSRKLGFSRSTFYRRLIKLSLPVPSQIVPNQKKKSL